MQGLFIFAVIMAAITGLMFLGVVATRKHRGTTDRDGSMTDQAGIHLLLRVNFWVLLVGTLVTLFFCSLNPVGTREIGIVSLYGSLQGHVGPGANFLPPWDNLTTIDDSYQLTDLTFTVRIANGQTAQVTEQVRWNATDAAADDIYANYKTTQGMEKGLLDPEVNVVTNTVLDGYNPLAALATGAPAGTPGNPSTAQLGDQIQAQLVKRIGADINIRTFNLKPLVYDIAVQNQLNTAYTQAGKTVQAQLAEKTAAAQALANQALAVGLASNPLVLVQQCMTAISNGEFQPPAGFSCWPGNGSGVVIPSGK